MDLSEDSVSFSPSKGGWAVGGSGDGEMRGEDTLWRGCESGMLAGGDSQESKREVA